MPERILVIRLGALGDLVLCMEAFQAIRRAHPQAEIALLTMPAFAEFGRMMPWFDRVFTDSRPPAWRVDAWWRLVQELRAFAPTRVYDLQGKGRQSVVFHLLGKPVWSGATKGCSHPRLWPPEPGMHFTDFLRAQLARAGLERGGESLVDTLWLDAPLDGFTLPERYVLLIPGCSPQHPHKRWPVGHYAELARRLQTRGLGCVAVGTRHEAEVLEELVRQAPHVVNLCGQTSLLQLAALARRAAGVVGNDTGPMHLAAAVGAPTLALLSGRTNPIWSAPKGLQAAWLQEEDLEKLSVEKVMAEIAGWVER